MSFFANLYSLHLYFITSPFCLFRLPKAEAESRKKAETELTELKEKVRKLESECLASLGRA
jgi:hypothetical protein